MSSIQIQIGNRREAVPFSGTLPISTVTASYGLAMPCGGHHTCGKCKIKAFGALSPLTTEELRLLTADEIEQGLSPCLFSFGCGGLYDCAPR